MDRNSHSRLFLVQVWILTRFCCMKLVCSVLFPPVSLLSSVLCSPGTMLFILLIPHTKETLDLLLARPTSATVVAITLISYTVLPLLILEKPSFQASFVKSFVLHSTCILNPILFCVAGGFFFLFFFADCQGADFISLQCCSQGSRVCSQNHGRCDTDGGLLRTAPPLPLPCRMQKDGFAQ